MLRLRRGTIEGLIYPVGFYRTKARQILATSRILLDRHGGEVPAEMEALLALPGVGRKTANLVVTVAYGRHGICVDTHVHRISNRFGLARTKTPEETESVLRRVLPRRYWIEYNGILVTWGQNVCHPTSPRCSSCAVVSLCPRVGVARWR
jgi:endonuclease-3